MSIMPFTVWCTVEITKSNGTKQENVVSSRFLETEYGEKVTSKDLFFGNLLIWRAKGKPYQVVLETHSKLV